VNLGDLTGGIYSSANLLQGNNLGCFMFEAAQQAVPAALSGLAANLLAPILTMVNNAISPATTMLNCPALLTWNQAALSQYPGASYHPSPP
jgi:hypothetical protein